MITFQTSGPKVIKFAKFFIHRRIQFSCVYARGGRYSLSVNTNASRQAMEDVIAAHDAWKGNRDDSEKSAAWEAAKERFNAENITGPITRTGNQP